uniref:Uncharacterized protein n=1 Tax=Arundo donax TaxID=35708 RepID=A0A0A8YME4_ARUDO
MLDACITRMSPEGTIY